MIPLDYITAWRRYTPWTPNPQIEQDLVVSRALVELFNQPSIAEALALRGGTALYKLQIRPALRYSEDIDLVQRFPGPIGDTMDAIRQQLDPWLGPPRRNLHEGRVILLYRFEAEEPHIPMRLKIEINSREHFTHLGFRQMPFAVDNPWFAGQALVTTYAIDELAGTKLRALYQRRKGRDLFDLWLALDRGLLQPDAVVACFLHYMQEGKTPVSRAEFEANLAAKAQDSSFHHDVQPLLSPTVHYDPEAALELVGHLLVTRLPGAPWQGA